MKGILRIKVVANYSYWVNTHTLQSHQWTAEPYYVQAPWLLCVTMGKTNSEQGCKKQVSVLSRILDTMRLVRHYGLKSMRKVVRHYTKWSHVRHHQFQTPLNNEPSTKYYTTYFLSRGSLMLLDSMKTRPQQKNFSPAFEWTTST